MKYRCPNCCKAIETSHQKQSKEVKFFPFCSQRCKLVDLGAWLDAKYKVISDSNSRESDKLSNVFSDAITNER